MNFSPRHQKISSGKQSPSRIIPIVERKSKQVSPSNPLEGGKETFTGKGKSNRPPVQGIFDYKTRIIDYKNLVLLKKFITSEGKILPRRVSGLTAKQQRHIAKAIKNARMIGLLPFIIKSKN